MENHDDRPKKEAPPGFRWIFVRQFKHWRSGKIIKAKDHGREAFCFLVRSKSA